MSDFVTLFSKFITSFGSSSRTNKALHALDVIYSTVSSHTIFLLFIMVQSQCLMNGDELSRPGHYLSINYYIILSGTPVFLNLVLVC